MNTIAKSSRTSQCDRCICKRINVLQVSQNCIRFTPIASSFQISQVTEIWKFYGRFEQVIGLLQLWHGCMLHYCMNACAKTSIANTFCDQYAGFTNWTDYSAIWDTKAHIVPNLLTCFSTRFVLLDKDLKNAICTSAKICTLMIVEKGEMLLPIIRMRHRHLQTEESSSTSLWNDEKNTTNEEEQKTGNAREKKKH